MTHPLENRVRSVARLAKLMVLACGVGYAVTVVLVVTIGLGLLDYWVRHQETGLRYLFSAVIGLTVIWAIRYCVLPALKYRVSDLAVADRLEQRFPQLQHQLSTTLAFLKMPASEDALGSSRLRQAVITQTDNRTESLNLHQAIDFRRPIQALASTALVAVLTILLFTADSQSAGLALARLMTPWATTDWPSRHDLRFANLPPWVARGERLEVHVTDRNGQLPESVKLDVREIGAPNDKSLPSIEMILLGDKMVAQLPALRESVEIRALGGDGDTGWRRLRVAEPPRLGALRVRIKPPAYTGLPEQIARGDIRAWAGSHVWWDAEPGTLLRSADICFHSAANPEVTRHAMQWEPSAERFYFPETVDPGWQLSQSGHYTIQLTNLDGFVGRDSRQWSLTAVEDVAPQVTLESLGLLRQVTAQAIVPLSIHVNDDLRINEVSLQVQTSRETGTEPRVHTIRAATENLHAAAGDSDLSEWPIGDSFDAQPVFDLGQIPNLAPGDRITLVAYASDYRPQVGQSPPFELTIVSADQMLELFVHHQTAIFEEIAEALRLQTDAAIQVDLVSRRLSDLERTDQATLNSLRTATIAQHKVNRLLGEPATGVAAKLAALLEQFRLNRIPAGQHQAQLARAWQTVQRLNRELLPPIDRDLTDSLRSLTELLDSEVSQAKQDPPSVVQALDRSRRLQQQVVAELAALVGELNQWADYQQLASRLRVIHSKQVALAIETKALRQTRLQPAASNRQREVSEEKEIARRQSELAIEFEQLQAEMQSMSDQLNSSNPQAAETLVAVLKEAARAAISGSMRQAAQQVQQQQWGEAERNQRQIASHLETLIQLLSALDERQRNQWIQGLQSAKADLEQLAMALGQVRSEVLDTRQRIAAGESVPSAVLQRLAQQLSALASRTRHTAERLTQLQASRAGQHAEDAGRLLDRAVNRLNGEQLTDALRDVDGAQGHLADAIDQVGQSLRSAEQSQLQDRLGQLRTQVEGLVQRQKETLAAATQLNEDNHVADRATVSKLTQQQLELITDTRAVAERVSDIPTFQLAFELAIGDMNRAAGRLRRRQMDSETTGAMSRAVAQLSQILSATEMPTPTANQDAPPAQPNQNSQQDNPVDSRQRIAELQLLRWMQSELLRRTEELDQAKQAPEVAPEVLARQAKQLAADQVKVSELMKRIADQAETSKSPESPAPRLPNVPGFSPADNPDGGRRSSSLSQGVEFP